jgi:hypothetical protein
MLILSRLSSPSASAKGSTSNADRRSRWALLAKPTLGVALAMGVLTAGQAQAMVVNLGGQDLEVIPFTGTYSNNVDEMTSIPPIPPEPPLPECIGPGGRRVWMTAVSGVYPNQTILHITITVSLISVHVLSYLLAALNLLTLIAIQNLRRYGTPRQARGSLS